MANPNQYVLVASDDTLNSPYVKVESVLPDDYVVEETFKASNNSPYYSAKIVNGEGFNDVIGFFPGDNIYEGVAGAGLLTNSESDACIYTPDALPGMATSFTLVEGAASFHPTWLGIYNLQTARFDGLPYYKHVTENVYCYYQYEIEAAANVWLLGTVLGAVRGELNYYSPVFDTNLLLDDSDYFTNYGEDDEYVAFSIAQTTSTTYPPNDTTVYSIPMLGFDTANSFNVPSIDTTQVLRTLTWSTNPLTEQPWVWGDLLGSTFGIANMYRSAVELGLLEQHVHVLAQDINGDWTVESTIVRPATALGNSIGVTDIDLTRPYIARLTEQGSSLYCTSDVPVPSTFHVASVEIRALVHVPKPAPVDIVPTQHIPSRNTDSLRFFVG